MDKNPVTSSTIAAIGYDEDSQTLEIEFLNGNVYQYFDVPQYIGNEILNAPSCGQYLSQNIKGIYRYSKV